MQNIVKLPVRTLMGPGPSEINPRVLAALSQPAIGHLDPAFVALMDEVKSLLRYAFQTNNRLTFPVSGPGSAGMETCFINLLEAGDKVVVARNGVFGTRMQQMASRLGAEVVPIDDEWGAPVDPNKLEEALRAHPDACAVAFVHAETSTGVLSDAQTLAQIARRHDCLTIVDAVTSLAGSPLYVDDWGLDAVYSGAQKCLSCVAGISPVTIGERALEKIARRASAARTWFHDLELIDGYWSEGGARSYHHTAPVNSIFALAEALRLLNQEGLEQAWERHRENSKSLVSGLQELGLEMWVQNPSDRLPQLNMVRLPNGFDEATVRLHLLNDHDLEIGAGLGPLVGQVWRIGLMGYSSRPENVALCLSTLKRTLALLSHQSVSGES
ncbi:MAG: alanine--glyoxylate aminotransferase family protein [Planctomycetaceae bacterium]|nr:alanine--glyoxylate aminotransferase family protein [Planctomycetaceae bacterium]